MEVAYSAAVPWKEREAFVTVTVIALLEIHSTMKPRDAAALAQKKKGTHWLHHEGMWPSVPLAQQGGY
jgi:hypothetical protein